MPQRQNQVKGELGMDCVIELLCTHNTLQDDVDRSINPRFRVLKQTNSAFQMESRHKEMRIPLSVTARLEIALISDFFRDKRGFISTIIYNPIFLIKFSSIFKSLGRLHILPPIFPAQCLFLPIPIFQEFAVSEHFQPVPT